MKLGQLINTAGEFETIDISGLSEDSRIVKPGYLFAALKGTQADGRSFIDDAVFKGANAILLDGDGKDAPPKLMGKTPVFTSKIARREWALIASRFFQQQPETVVAVTGTNGKTSVAAFVRQMFSSLGAKAASMGTLGVVSPTRTWPLNHTTPGPVELHKHLAHLAQEGITHTVIEASSHGLSQHRLDGVKLKAAAFTNLSQDHLDYHDSLQDYFRAKARLFTELLGKEGTAVLNAETKAGRQLGKICADRGQKVLYVGEREGESQDLTADDIIIHRHQALALKQAVQISYQGKAYTIAIPLVGHFQLSNALIAAGLTIAAGFNPDVVFESLKNLDGVPGRLQGIGTTPSGAGVFVDYAHTPHGIETVLKALRPHTANKLAIVFGAGGDRDQTKRPLMGKAAEAHADRIYITDDNPRSEKAASIRQMILAAAPSAKVIGDRREAIHQSITDLQKGDNLIIAGKGHETGQTIGAKTIPFDDAEVAGTFLEKETKLHALKEKVGTQ